MPILSEEENEKERRRFAERIICGDFEAVAIVLLNADGQMEYFYNGGRCRAIRMLRDAEFAILRQSIEE